MINNEFYSWLTEQNKEKKYVDMSGMKTAGQLLTAAMPKPAKEPLEWADHLAMGAALADRFSLGRCMAPGV